MEDCIADEDGEEDDRRRHHQELMELIGKQEHIEAIFGNDLELSKKYYQAVEEQNLYEDLYLQLCDPEKDYMSMNILESESPEDCIGYGYLTCKKIVEELRVELFEAIIISDIHFSLKKRISLLLEKNLESKYVPEINISEPAEEQEAECMNENEDLRNISEPAEEKDVESMDEMEDIRNLLITMEIKMSELEAEFNEEELEFADNWNMKGMILQELHLFNNMMTLELQLDTWTWTSLGIFFIGGVSAVHQEKYGLCMVMNMIFWYRSLFDRGK